MPICGQRSVDVKLREKKSYDVSKYLYKLYKLYKYLYMYIICIIIFVLFVYDFMGVGVFMNVGI